MAANADSVVVELIAKTEQLDKPVQQSAAQFDANMNKIVASATKAEAAVTRSSAARSAALQRESGQISQFSTMLSRDMDIVGAKMLSPSSPFVVPVKQAPQVSNAMRVMSVGGSLLSGVLGGTLLTAGVALIAMLVDLARKTGDESDEIRDLVEKLKEHARQSRLSEEADRIWSQTLDGLIERQRRLNEELGKRLTTQGQADEAALRQAQGDVTRLSGDIEAERAQNEALHRQIAAAKRAPAEGGNPDEIAANEAARVTNIAQLESQLRKSDELLKKLTSSLSDAQSRITRGQIIAGEAQGNAVADLTEGAKQFAEQYANVLRTIQQGNPTLTPFSDKINSSASSLTKAANEAAAAGVHFSVVTNRVSGLDNKLNLGEITVKTYATEVRKLANELKAMTEAAKEAAKQDPVKNFKASVIGAEGVGPNRMGSSAAGFGQFMPSTWESYFKRLFPDQSASLSTKQIDDLRNKRQIAEAVIDAATDDYVKVLKSAGVKVTEASLYTVHLLGEPAARKFFAAPAAASTQSVLGKGVVDVNPFLKGTVADARAAIAKRIGDSSAAISQGAAALAQTLQQEAEEEKQRSARYQQQKAELEGQVVDARGALAVSAQQTADTETLAVEVARQAYARNVDRDVEAGRLRADDAIELKKINDERAKLRQQLVDQRLRQAQFAAAEAGYARGRDLPGSASYEAEAEYLQSVEALAKSSSDAARSSSG
jgi:hypothetical protein